MESFLDSNINEPVKSSEATGSSVNINTDKNSNIELEELVELCRLSTMQGYQFAIDLLKMCGNEDAVKLLENNYAVVEFNLIQASANWLNSVINNNTDKQ